MILSSLDWSIIGLYFLISLAVGIWASRRAKESTKSYFLAGRNMPWWLLGISMVATTFSTDTPNLVTDLVRKDGVSGNWGWWAFLLTGMLTVFVYSKLWHRSGVLTDIEFYELRYSGKAAAFLRGFRAVYLGLVFNVLVMGTVSLAAIKFGEIVLGLPGWLTLLIAGSITIVYSTLGGLKAVIITDFIQFILAMIGSIWAMLYILGLPQINGLNNLITHSSVMDKLSLIPDLSEPDAWVPVLLVPLAVQWWASYYPGSEPGGGGYIAQRMFSARDESNALLATFFFNVAHYALRPWPWIIIALASIIIFPTSLDLRIDKKLLIPDKELALKIVSKGETLNHQTLIESLNYFYANENDYAKKENYKNDLNIVKKKKNSIEIKSWSYLHYNQNLIKGELIPVSKRLDPLVAKELITIHLFSPDIPIDKLGHDLGYPLMLTFLPTGLLGLVAASLIAAFMSTMSTQLNLGASYLVNDFYHRFFKPDASEKELVLVGKFSTVISIILGSGLGLLLTSAEQAFTLLLMIGAGTGMIYILRWFWWRINAYTEIVAMVSSLFITGYFNFGNSPLEGWQKIVLSALLTTIVWILATYFTPPDDEETLQNFVKKVNPGGPGWAKYSDGISLNESWPVPNGILCMLLGCFVVYGFLLGVGQLIYGNIYQGMLICCLGTTALIGLLKIWK